MSRNTMDNPPIPDDLGRWARAQSVFGLILDQARDGIILQDIHGHIEWANPAWEAMFGIRLDDIRGRKPQEFVLPPEIRPSDEEIAAFRYDLSPELLDQYEVIENIRSDGSRFWNQLSFALVDLGLGDTRRKIVVTCRDITEQMDTELALRQVTTDLERVAHHDDLTGLANRKKLQDFWDSEIVGTQMRQAQLGVLQIDIDKFKGINDTLGHAAGDATLCHVARALSECARQGDLVCRTGGDEFLLICLGLDTPDALLTRAEQVLRRIREPLAWNDQQVLVGVSIGGSLSKSACCTGEILMQQADQALYRAKSSGRDRVVMYNEPLGRTYRARQALARDLQAAITENQFTMYLQPQLQLQDDTITGCEALIRWQHPERGLLPPGQFLPMAEQNHLMAEIDYVSMNLALDALADLQQAGFSGMSMSLNVSSSILGDVNYPGLLEWALQSRELDPATVCVEILETTILERVELDIVTAVERLKQLGVRVALDDFGTGYAGLAHMTRFEIDAIKLDRSMIRRLPDDPKNQLIVRSIIRLCSQLGMQVVAEGVETPEQLDLLRRSQCPLIQGFGLARPMPVSDLIVWLRQRMSVSCAQPFGTDERRAALPLARDQR